MNKGGVKFSAASIIIVLVVVAAGLAMSYLSAIGTREESRAVLTDRAATIATALDSDKVSKLKGEVADANLPEYRELQTKLRLLKQNSPDARSIYLSVLKDDQVYFTVDSEAAGSSYYSPPGELYGEASDLYKHVFVGTSPAVEGPLADGYGNWVTGFAPVVDLSTGRTVGVVGIDIDASGYRQGIFLAATSPLLVALLFLGVVVAYEWNRRRQQQELRVRSELMSVASHELRTPITGMRWAAESLLHMLQQGPTRAMVQAMYDSVLNLQAGAEDILQLTRLQKNPKMQMAPTDLVKLVAEICNTQRIEASQKHVVIKFDESWPQSLTMSCDPARMKQVFHNVVSNAVKYTNERTTVTLGFRRDSKNILISVADQGIGIPASEQSRVFDGFYRASNAKASGQSGTGLGLYLARSIIRQHDGKITFTSVEGKGTTVTVALPVPKV